MRLFGLIFASFLVFVPASLAQEDGLSFKQRLDLQIEFQESQRYLMDMHDAIKAIIKNQHQLDEENRLDMKDIYGDMMNALIDDLDDPYATYLSGEEAEKFIERYKGKRDDLTGVGFEYKMVEPGEFIIMQVFDGTPAGKAGVQSGWVIDAVDGTEITEDTDTSSIRDMIVGEANTEVKIRFRSPEGDTETLTMVREIIEINPIRTHLFDNGVLYVSFPSFTQKTPQQFLNTVDQFDGQYDSIIMDLRGNPGGMLSSAVELADLFLEPGKDITVARHGSREEVMTSENRAKIDEELVILIDGVSASASEIISGTMQAHGRATIIGEKSYGKGTVQTVVPLKRTDGLFKFTIAEYYVGEDGSIEMDGVGVTPDIVVDLDFSPSEVIDSMKDLRESQKIDVSRDLVEYELDRMSLDPSRDKILDRALKYLKP